MENLCFTIGNALIERKIYFENGAPMRVEILNKKTGAVWASDGKESLIAFPGIDFTGAKVELNDTSINIKGADYELSWEFRVFDDIPMIESKIGIRGKSRTVNMGKTIGGDGVETVETVMSNNDYIEGFGSLSNHVSATVTEFFDRTDYTNNLVDKREILLYNKFGITKCNGHIFALREKITGEECLVVKNAPCAEAHYNKHCEDFIAAPISNIHIAASGIDMGELSEEEFTYSYPVAIGVCSKGESDELFRTYFRKDYKSKTTYTMSNTWGDRNQDKCICEEFILSEIERAARIGADIVQIDDGWQTGITANSALAKGGAWNGGYRMIDPNFWKINEKKFPNGFDKLVAVAKEKGVKIGLWFSPDDTENYRDWELDADTLVDFYTKYGIKYFKLDGIKIENRIGEANVYKMLQKIIEKTNDDVVFNMDITNGKRYGYLFHKEVGDLFVENRYSDWGNYYPHNTLKNLWELAHYFPTERLQMELLNNQRNTELYDDILAPVEYDMDYLFASVMVADPLLWMELSSLSEDAMDKLAKIISVYKKYRDDFVKVTPILEKPDGFSQTGFMIEGKENNYVILLRELGEECDFDIDVKEILATNDESASCSPTRLNKKRSYIFGIC